MGSAKSKASNKMINEITPILENYAKENAINLILQKKNIVMGKKNVSEAFIRYVAIFAFRF